MAATDKPTDKQLKYLRDLSRRAGPDCPAPATRREASETILRLRGGKRAAKAEAPRPTKLQMKRLRQLAERTGQTFAWPTTRQVASLELERMLGIEPLTGFERYEDVAAVHYAPSQYATEVRPDEVAGYGGSAHWAGAA